MISVYVKKFNPIPDSDWSDGETETLLFSIPNQNGNIRPFLTATVNNEMGNAGSFEFSLDPKNIWYNIWRHMRTLVRVEYDGDNIFYGRVLTIDRDMFRSRTIHCEGAFTFFMDSVFQGEKNGFTITLHEYLQKLIDAHNECMTDAPEKKIYLGEVPGFYSAGIDDVQKITDDTQKFGAFTDFKKVKDCLEETLRDYGGYMRVRYNSTDGKLYLDWLKMYFNTKVSDQVLSVNSNVVDLSDTVEVDNIFTHVIPLGKDGKSIDGTGGEGASGGGNGNRHTITLISEGEGFETYGFVKSSTKVAAKGATITITASPKDGYAFNTWTVLEGEVTLANAASPNTSFEMGTADVIISANFKKGQSGGLDPDCYLLSISTGQNGTVSATEGPQIAVGTRVYLKATPNPGYRLVGYSSAQVTVSNSSFVMPAKNVTVTATFEAST